MKSVLCSILFFCGCSTIMSCLGDAVAWYRMPKYDTIKEAKSHILYDFGHELIPYTCELSVIQRNMQTTVILFSLPLFVIRCYFLRNGKWIFNSFTRLVGCMMLLRTITMISTAFPNPNPQCMGETTEDISYREAVLQTISTFPTKACGNLMFSGHTMFLTLFCIFEIRYLQLNRICHIMSLAKTGLGIYYIIACRSHYTIDVVISLLMTGLVFHAYTTRTEHVKTDDFFVRFEMV